MSQRITLALFFAVAFFLNGCESEEVSQEATSSQEETEDVEEPTGTEEADSEEEEAEGAEDTTGGEDLCKEVACPETEAICINQYTLAPSTSSTCDPLTGECVEGEEPEPILCSESNQVCQEGACVESNDPCEFMLCETGSTCYEGECYWTYCEGECGSPCDDLLPGCEGSGICDKYNTCRCDDSPPICEEDLCEGVVCPEEEAYCISEYMASPSIPSSCDPSTGECVAGAQPEPIACDADYEVCQDGACIEATDPCEFMLCETGSVCFEGECVEVFCTEGCGEPCSNPTPDCEGAGVCNAFNSCVCASGPEPICPSDDLCADVVCPSSPPFCEDGIAYSGTYSECNPNTGECLMAPGAPPQNCEAMGMVCLDGACVDDLCADFVPPCDSDEQCAKGEVCSFEGCNPSNCGCDPETGDVFCTYDCGGGVCVKDLCAGVECPNSPASCDGNFALSPTVSACDPSSGQCLFAPGAPPQDCEAMGMICSEGICTDNLCSNFQPPCNQDEDCAGGEECSFEGCNPSSCGCDPETGSVMCTADCGGGQCVPSSSFEPCEGKVCGEGCSPCPPGTPCPEFLVPNLCDGDGQCVSSASNFKCEGDAECLPGVSFTDEDDCNTCECPVSGLTAEANCTKLFCP